MEFYLSDSHEFLNSSKQNIIVLYLSSWDDWFSYSTLYSIYYFDENSDRIHVGSTKIGQLNMLNNQRTPNLPTSFNNLDNVYFSLGQDVSYYENLNDLGEDIRDTVLNSLNDIALKNDQYNLAINERVTKQSLLRDVSLVSVLGEYRRLAQGIVELTPYNFNFLPTKYYRDVPRMVLEFHVIPKSNPPSNIHVVIGRNGVGKTYLFNSMIDSLINPTNNKYKAHFSDADGIYEKLFANLVSVSFSAFDETIPVDEKKDKLKNINYSYIGLRKRNKSGIIISKSPRILRNEFVKSVEKCRLGAKNLRWQKALEVLEADPIFKEAEVSKIAKLDLEEEFIKLSSDIFNKLSSGHKIVLLTITRLVETIQERSLVLLDEPEGYLHPPLLSAFVRALSDLLIQRNAVAIIGTHSPVVLQEVPKSCAWKLRRHGIISIAERLEIESFGENVGLLTQEVFGLEVMDSGFNKLLHNVVTTTESYDDAIKVFDNQLGMEAKAILRSLFYQKKN